MMRFAFTMKLKPGMKLEYEKRHAEIWPEMVELLRASGVSDYTIFLDEATDTLFAFQKISGSGSSQDLGTEPVVRKWWTHMADIMETNPDDSPRTRPLDELWHMD